MRMNSELNQLYCRAMLDREYLKKALYSLQLKQFCDIADVGCGPGGSTKIIQDCYPNASIVGIDKSKKAIEYARKKVGGKIRFLYADAANLPCADEMFDCCVARMLLDIVTDYDKILHELVRLVKRRGFLLLYGNTRTTAEGNPLPRYATEIRNAYKRYKRLTNWIGFDTDIISNDLENKYHMKVSITKILKDVNHPGRKALQTYYAVPKNQLTEIVENNIYVRLNMIKKEAILAYEQDLYDLLQREDTYLTFEQTIIIAQKGCD